MTWSRRKFIRTGLLTATGFVLLDAFWIEKFFIETNEFFIGKATEANIGVKVIQISDLHIQTVNYQLKRLAQRLNRLNPDLILITGDTVDTNKNLFILNNFLKLIHRDIKKVAVLGNWEYWGRVNLTDLESVYSANNCNLMINKTGQYTFRDKTISITGVDDFVAGQANILSAISDLKTSDYHIILNHCPEYADIISEKVPGNIPVDLILSGHTHGGQINIFGFIPFLPQGSGNYLKGWYKDDKKNLYVSKGIGTSVLPMRFMARSEIAVFNLA